MTEEYWFKPKHHGYGATPSHWKGWLVTFLFALALAVGSIMWLQSLGTQKPVLGVVLWAIAVLLAVWLFCRFAKTKTDGPWAWRWNGKLYSEMFKGGSGPDTNNR